MSVTISGTTWNVNSHESRSDTTKRSKAHKPRNNKTNDLTKTLTFSGFSTMATSIVVCFQALHLQAHGMSV